MRVFTTEVAPLTPTEAIEADPTLIQTFAFTVVAVTRLRLEDAASLDSPDIKPGVPITAGPPTVLRTIEVVVVTWPPPFPPTFPPPGGTGPFPVAARRFWYAELAVDPTATRSEMGLTAVMNGSW